MLSSTPASASRSLRLQPRVQLLGELHRVALGEAQRLLQLVRGDVGELAQVRVRALEVGQPRLQPPLLALEVAHLLDQALDHHLALGVEQQALGDVEPDGGAVGAPQLDLAGVQLAARVEPLQQALAARVGEIELREVQSQGLLERGHAEQPEERGVGLEQPLVEGGAEDPDAGAVEQALQPQLGPRQVAAAGGALARLAHRGRQAQIAGRRLGEDVVDPGAQRRDRVLQGRPLGEHHRRGPRPRRPSLAQRLEAAHPSQAKLGDHHVEVAAAQRRGQGGGVARLGDAHARDALRQDRGREAAIGRVVVDQQDVGSGAHPPTAGIDCACNGALRRVMPRIGRASFVPPLWKP